MLLTMENRMCHLQKDLYLSLSYPSDELCTKGKIEALEWTLEEHLL